MEKRHIYTGKGLWLSFYKLPCLHCGGEVRYTPIPLAVSETNGGIIVRNGFCSWPCCRAYANQLGTDDKMEHLTTKILNDFRSSFEDGDDRDSWNFIQPYRSFAQIPAAPPRHEFKPHGSLSPRMNHRPTAVPVSVIEMPVPFVDTTIQAATFVRATGYSTKKPYRSWTNHLQWPKL